MLKYFVAIPLFVLGALGYTAQAVYKDPMTPATDATYTGRSVMAEHESVPTTETVEASAEAFAERINVLMQLSSSSALSTTDAVVFRTTITDRFHEAFTEISRLEDVGNFTDAARAREIMQIAIDDYLHATPATTPDITRDLKTYSKFMTETLIERSVKNA